MGGGQADGAGGSRTCPGCGLTARRVDGPTHPYIGASPECWARFTELSVQPLGATAGGEMLVDTYALQHPGVPERRAVQSVCVHAIVLCATLERDWPADRAVQLRRRALARPPAPWRWLDPPSPVGTLTVDHPLSAADPDERGRRVRAWAEDVWAAYSSHHDEIRSWVEALLA